MRARRRILTLCAAALLGAPDALADDGPTGAPPPEAKALVEAPKAAADVPTLAAPKDETSVTLSAGGQLATGNSQLLAGTANGKFELRRGSDGFGASLLGNYAQGLSGTQPGSAFDTSVQKMTAANLQGRVRYDRFIADDFSLFLITTGRFDHFQGLDLRLNIDPGVKYLFFNTGPTAFWGELGYDFQYDIRNDSALPQPDGTRLDKTAVDHSVRGFVGFKHAFNKEVSLVTGLEYLQSLVDNSSVDPTQHADSRVNFDALFAANIGGGFALGLGFSARFDNKPLPTKQQWDTATTLSLIYAYSAAAAAAPPAPSPPPPPPPPPPAAAPPPQAPAAAPPPAAAAPDSAAPAAPPAAVPPAPTPAPPPPM